MRDLAIDIATARLNRLRYILLPGQPSEEALAPFHDQAYRLWTRSWRQTFEDLKSDAVLRADDFLRQSIVGGLFEEEQAVGLLLHSHFNLGLEAAVDHTYLATYPLKVLAELQAQGHREVLSMEYLTLDNDWRKSRVGLPLGEVLLGLGTRILESSGFRAMVVVTRNDKRVNETLYGFGARCLAPNLTKHNVSVDLVSVDQGRSHPGPNAEVNRWIDHYWERRENHTRLLPTPSLRRTG